MLRSITCSTIRKERNTDIYLPMVKILKMVPCKEKEESKTVIKHGWQYNNRISLFPFLIFIWFINVSASYSIDDMNECLVIQGLAWHVKCRTQTNKQPAPKGLQEKRNQDISWVTQHHGGSKWERGLDCLHQVVSTRINKRGCSWVACILDSQTNGWL